MAARAFVTGAGPCGPPGAPQRSGPGIGGPLSADHSQVPSPPPTGPPGPRAKRTPPRAAEKGAQPRLAAPVGLSPRCHSLPLGHRAEGTFLTDLSFPQTSGCQTSRFLPDSGPATPISHSATASPLLLSQSRSGPFLGMIHYASYLEVLTSPLPSAARAAIGSWRPLLGHPAGAP